MILLSNVLSICPEDLGSYLPSIPTQNQARGPDFLSKQSERKGKSPSRIQLFVTPWTVALPGSSIHGIFQARILEWVAISFSHPLFFVTCFAEMYSTLKYTLFL